MGHYGSAGYRRHGCNHLYMHHEFIFENPFVEFVNGYRPKNGVRSEHRGFAYIQSNLITRFSTQNLLI